MVQEGFAVKLEAPNKETTGDGSCAVKGRKGFDLEAKSQIERQRDCKQVARKVESKTR